MPYKTIAILALCLATLRLLSWILGAICRRRCRRKWRSRILDQDYSVNMDDTEPVRVDDDETTDID